MKTKLALIAILAMFVFTGCGDDESPFKCSTCVDEPEANALYDATGQGIYKGTVVGSTGTIKIDIANDGSTYSALLVFDGEEFELVTDGTYNSETGFQAYFFNDMGTPNDELDDISFAFYASTSGSYEIYNIAIPGHPDAIIDLYKEFSDELVAVYEGTYSGDASGVFNMTIRGDEWLVAARDDSDGYTSQYYGEVSSDGVISCMQCGDVEISGIIKGDEVSGEWVSPEPSSGTWKGKRTL